MAFSKLEWGVSTPWPRCLSPVDAACPFYEAFGNDVGVPRGRDILKETERKVSSLTSIHSEFRER